MIYVRVAVLVSGQTSDFDYHLPPELEGRVSAGHLVSVPFGAQFAQGVVLEIIPSPAVAETKAVRDLLDPLPVLTPPLLDLARRLAQQTLNPLAAMLLLMLPPGLAKLGDTLFSLSSPAPEDIPLSFPLIQQRLLDLLASRGPLRGRQIERHFLNVDWRNSARALLARRLITRQAVLAPPGIRPKFVRMAMLAVSPAEAEAALPGLSKNPAVLARRQAALRFLVAEPEPLAVSWVYAASGCKLADLQELAEKELIVLFEKEIFRDPTAGMGLRAAQTSPEATKELILTPEQEGALASILAAASQPGVPKSFLLHGVTGSGKTEIYLRAAAETLRAGKSALILVPEIAMTPQMVNRFLQRFPGQVGLIHSQLTDGERYDTWRRARGGQLRIIIGPRSALFAPLPAPGLIVLDECHDSSYAQTDTPFYNAVSAGEDYARRLDALLILGSATPAVEMMGRALRARGTDSSLAPHLLSLPSRLKGPQTQDLPPVTVVDMREELKARQHGSFSRALLENLAEVLEQGQQAILYLNRRGSATYVFCRDCGHVLKCPRCETPLTFHLSAESGSGAAQAGSAAGQPGLVCHHCGYTRRIPARCPACGSDKIRSYGLGSEKVETEIKSIFPAARVLRWDWETTREKDAHEMILTHFLNHQADILVGTQMIAKGLDLPLVTLVGIVLADVGLTLPDPFASERVFQLLTQVAGRAGRADLPGRVILQTFLPENPVIQMAAKHDYAAFFQWELENRRKLGYPPFARLLRLEYRHSDPQEAGRQAHLLADQLKERIQSERRVETSIIGPVPCFFSRQNGAYRWQIVLRGPDPLTLLGGSLPGGWRVEVDPLSLL